MAWYVWFVFYLVPLKYQIPIPQLDVPSSKENKFAFIPVVNANYYVSNIIYSDHNLATRKDNE